MQVSYIDHEQEIFNLFDHEQKNEKNIIFPSYFAFFVEKVF
jgi:hypothetical protein